jgi:hypothetical protein
MSSVSTRPALSALISRSTAPGDSNGIKIDANEQFWHDSKLVQVDPAHSHSGMEMVSAVHIIGMVDIYHCSDCYALDNMNGGGGNFFI